MELSVEKILNYIEALPEEKHFIFSDSPYYQYAQLIKNPLFENKEKAVQFVKETVKNIRLSQNVLQKFYDPFLEEIIFSSLEEELASILIYQVSYLIELEEINKNKDFFKFLVNLFLEKDNSHQDSFERETVFFNVLVKKAQNKEEKKEILKWLKKSYYSLNKKTKFLNLLIFLSTLMQVDIEVIEKKWIDKKGFCPKNLWAKLFLLNVFDKEDVPLIGFLNNGIKQLNKLPEKDQILTVLSILLLKNELKILKKTGLKTIEKPSIESLISLFLVLIPQKFAEKNIEESFLFKVKNILSIDSLIKVKLLINVIPTIEKHIFYKESFEAMSEINKIFEVIFNTNSIKSFITIFYAFVSIQKVFDINKVISKKNNCHDKELISLSKIVYETIMDIIKTEDSSRGISVFYEEIEFFLNYFINKKNNEFKIPLIRGKVGRYEYKILTKDDTQGVLLGYQTNCCQHLGGAGDTCVKIGYYEPNSGFFTVNKKGRSYMQSWIYENTISAAKKNQMEKLKILILDSIEVAAREKEHVSNDLIESYKKAIKELSNYYDLILIGFSGQEGKEAREKFINAFQKIYLDNPEITEFINENKQKIYPFENKTYNDFVENSNAVIGYVSSKIKSIINDKVNYVFKFEENFNYKKSKKIEDFFTFYKKIDSDNLFAEEIKNLLLNDFTVSEDYQKKIVFSLDNFVIVKSPKLLFRDIFEKSRGLLTYIGEVYEKFSLEHFLKSVAVKQEKELDFNSTNEPKINNSFITPFLDNKNKEKILEIEDDSIPF